MNSGVTVRASRGAVVFLFAFFICSLSFIKTSASKVGHHQTAHSVRTSESFRPNVAISIVTPGPCVEGDTKLSRVSLNTPFASFPFVL